MECYLFKPGFGGGGGASMAIKTVFGSIISLTDSAERPLRGLRLFGKTTQNGTPSPEAPVPLESVSDGGSVGVTVAGKNLLENKAVTGTQRGITCTVNDDKTVSVEGTATGYVFYTINNFVFEGGREYILSGVTGGSSETYMFGITGERYDFGAGRKVMYANDSTKEIVIVIIPGATVNTTISPMISLVEGEYEPYKPAQTLTAQTPNGLPGIPVSSGGNYTDENGQQWVCDEVDFANGKYVQRVGKIKLDGSVIPSVFADGNNGGSIFGYDYSSLGMDIPSTRVHKLCDKLQASPITSPVSYKNCEIGYWGFNTDKSKDQFLLMNVGKFDSANDVAAWLALNPISFLYVLATPIETPLSAEELAQYAALHTNYPSTTIYNDADAYMEVKYSAIGG